MHIRGALLAGLMLGWAAPAQALLCGTVLDPMSVSATGLSFGTYFPSSANTATVTVNVSCGLLGLDLLPAFTVSLSPGNAASASARYMNRAGSHLNYNIYSTPAYTKVLGDGTGGTVQDTYSGLLSLGTISFTGYGTAPAGQFIRAGAYTDTILVTVTY